MPEEETLSETDIELYPNPVAHNLTVELENNTSEDYKIQILDQQGNIMLQTTSSTRIQELNIQGFETGVYWLRVVNGKSGVICKRFMKY